MRPHQVHHADREEGQPAQDVQEHRHTQLLLELPLRGLGLSPHLPDVDVGGDDGDEADEVHGDDGDDVVEADVLRPVEVVEETEAIGGVEGVLLLVGGDGAGVEDVVYSG